MLALVVLVILRISLPNSPIVSLLLVFGITQIGALGVAYIISGLHLVYKKTASITLALSTALLFLTGAITPLNNAPVLYVLTRFLPLTVGIELLRKIVFTDMSVVTLFAQTEFYWLILNSVTYGAVGFLSSLGAKYSP
ncbi:MAG: ABC transporter permease [Chloroflexi bacterium]|nr:ABC transporter permease [Chloroflexota bacterium]